MEYICIVCPNGCRLTVEPTPEGVVVKGNTCPKGEQYGRDESTDPRRVVTAVVCTTDPDHPCVPVKSDRPIAKQSIDKVLQYIYRLRIDLPVRRGEICVPDCCGTGASIVYTRTVVSSSRSDMS
jgi:CxxC motif-containing protein